MRMPSERPLSFNHTNSTMTDPRYCYECCRIYGGDPLRIYLSGHGLGAHLALLHVVQRAVVSCRDALLSNAHPSNTEYGGINPGISISNGTRRVREYGRGVWCPKVEGLFLLVPFFFHPSLLGCVLCFAFKAGH